MAKRYHATKKFAKIAELNRLIDAGGNEGAAARKDKRKMNDKWSKRNGSNVTGFYSKAHAKPGACVVTSVR